MRDAPPFRAAVTRARFLAAVVLLLACFVAQAARHVFHQDLTYDERSYFGLGAQIVEEGRFEGRALLHPPLSFYVSSLPLLLRAAPLDPEDARAVLLGRLLSLLAFALPLLVGVALWARALYGPKGGLAALALGAFSPTLLAHGPLTTPDAALSATGFFAVFLYWRSEDGRGTWAWALALGLALLSKATALLFVPVIVALALGRLGRGGARRVLQPLGLGLGLAWLVLWAGYGFSGLFAWKAKAALIERTPVQPVLRALAFAAAPFVPLPYFNTIGRQAHIAGGRWPNYLLGQVSFEGWRSYYAVALAVKETLPFLVLVAAALVSLRWLRPRREEWVLLLPVALFFAVFSLSHVQIGIRYLLPALPFLFVFAARLTLASAPALRVALGLLLAGHAASTTLLGPDFIAYFNEAAGGPHRGWLWLGDSNLDWGQNRTRAARWAAEHGAAFDPLRLPARGTVVLSTNRLQGILLGRGPYRLLRDEYAPIALVSANYLVYDLEGPRRFPPPAMVSIVSGPGWKASGEPSGDWTAPAFDDRAWAAAEAAPFAPGLVADEAYPATEAALLTCGHASATCAFRHTFTLGGPPLQAVLYLATHGRYELALNGRTAARSDRCADDWSQDDFRLTSLLSGETNVLALRVEGCGSAAGPAAFVEMRVARGRP